MNKLLVQNNYLIIPNFIDKDKSLELYDQFLFYCENSEVDGDPQVPVSKSVPNFLPFVEILCQKTQEVSSIVEESLLPTYVYSRIYYKGNVLERHTDRDACEVSLTLHLNGDKPWPIFIKNPSGEEKSVILKPGDAMLYLGKIAEHWREEYEGEKYGQVFLHYVRSRGDCSYAYFDKTKERETTDLKYPIEKNKVIVDTNKFISNPDSKLEDYIVTFDNIVPEDVCDELIAEYSNCEDLLPATIADINNPLNSKIRNCKNLNISSDNIIKKNYNKRKELDAIVFDCVSKSVRKYSNIFSNFKISIDTGYNFLRYDVGDFYTEHTDSYDKEQRSLSCSLQLNDDYEGGEFSFFGRKIQYKCKKGSAILFPSNFMYPHEIVPVTKGTRYSIISWLV
jgi:hypothetical protein